MPGEEASRQSTIATYRQFGLFSTMAWSAAWYICVMEHESYESDWLERAKGAGFLPFEVAHPEPTHTSFGGFGGGSNGSLHCDIAHTIDGDEIFIATAVGDHSGRDNNSCIRGAVLDVVQSRLEGDVTLPFTLHLTFDEQTVEILVDGVPVRFWGIVCEGLDGWGLQAFIDPRTVVGISGPAGSSPPIAIRRRQDLSIAGQITDS